MKRIQKKGWYVVILSILFLTLSSWAHAQTTLSGMVVFGASLSDPGNAFALTGQQCTPPYSSLDLQLIPPAPYAKGGHHFSNGPTWIEQLAQSLGFSSFASPAFQSNGAKAANYAIGGARARTVSSGASLSDEVGAFLQDVGGAAPSDALYVIEFGGNDLRDALVSIIMTGDPGAATPILQDALTAISDNIQALYGSGARNFFVWNAPNIGRAPAIRMLPSGVDTIAEMLSGSFNIGLDAVLSGLDALPGIKTMSFDANGVLEDLVDHPEAFGLSSVDQACVMPNTQPYECKNPDEFLFWDGIHPTRVVHTILAQRALLDLTRPTP
jgi:phospholipase/lecithinase/hemolysin